MESVIKNGIGYSDWSYESLAKELGLSGRQAFMYKMKAKSFTREELRQLERILQVKF
jgi:ribosome-binding protein aMBF1 (putative translation factor)